MQLSYAAVGSEKGIEELLDKQVDFAASDVPALPDGAKLQRFATVLGAVVPVYNLRGVDRELRFTPEILAGIYLGKITRWDAREIRDVNRGISLPNAPIAVVHRSDGSGTTYAFTDFLSKTSPAWKAAVGVGSTAHWPTGSGAAGNDGVASLVQQTPNSIGYVELTYAIQHGAEFRRGAQLRGRVCDRKPGERGRRGAIGSGNSRGNFIDHRCAWENFLSDHNVYLDCFA